MNIHIHHTKSNVFKASCNNSIISLYVSNDIDKVIEEIRLNHCYDSYEIVQHSVNGSIVKIIPPLS